MALIVDLPSATTLPSLDASAIDMPSAEWGAFRILDLIEGLESLEAKGFKVTAQYRNKKGHCVCVVTIS